MIKEALGDRFLQVLLTILVIVSLIFGYFIYEEGSHNIYFSQTMTEDQRSRAISIATADLFDNEQIRMMTNTIYQTYHVKDVLPPSPFHEVGPDLDRNRSLPAVEFVIGNESEPGVNILAFVNLDQGRVVYIGFIKRADVRGVLSQDVHTNISITDTGYHAGDTLTGAQKDKAVRIARENQTVQEKMRGMHSNATYRVNGVSVSDISFFKGNDMYIGAYPVIQFMEESSIYEGGLTVYVTVDPDRGKVVDSFAVINTPVMRPGNTP